MQKTALNLSGPNEIQKILTKELKAYIYKAKIIETVEGDNHRKNILRRLTEIIEDWSRKICGPLVCNFFLCFVVFMYCILQNN